VTRRRRGLLRRGLLRRGLLLLRRVGLLRRSEILFRGKEGASAPEDGASETAAEASTQSAPCTSPQLAYPRLYR